MFSGGYEYSTIAGLRSVISAYHEPIDGKSGEMNSGVAALLLGIFNNTPPQPSLPLHGMLFAGFEE